MALTVLGLFVIASTREAAAETFVVEDGRKIEGAIIQATRNGIVIKRSIGGMSQYRQDQIREVIIDTPEGTITGSYLGWADGVYALEVEKRVVRVRDGKIVGTGPGNLPAKRPVQEEPGKEPAATDAPRSDDAGPAPERGIGGPIDPITPVQITGHAAPAREDDPALVYGLTLSREADGKIILIYATIADTAQPGSDFMTKSGVITIEPGETEAEILVPLIDDDLAEGEENVHLYLTVDPAVAALASRTIVATIRDND